MINYKYATVTNTTLLWCFGIEDCVLTVKFGLKNRPAHALRNRVVVLHLSINSFTKPDTVIFSWKLWFLTTSIFLGLIWCTTTNSTLCGIFKMSSLVHENNASLGLPFFSDYWTWLHYNAILTRVGQAYRKRDGTSGRPRAVRVSQLLSVRPSVPVWVRTTQGFVPDLKRRNITSFHFYRL